MKQLPYFGDERVLAFCAFCGGKTGTRDHCPSRVFLDKPYPENLPVVPACSTCNTGFSEDEEYLACLLSCVIVGSTDPRAVPREKIKHILERKPALRARIEQSRSATDGSIVFNPEHERVSSIVTKLAKGHALYELNESCTRDPDDIICMPLSLMTHAQREAFEYLRPINLCPEVGSRAMQRIIVGTDISFSGWLDVQLWRYRYSAMAGAGVEIRIVINEYLAGYVYWDG